MSRAAPDRSIAWAPGIEPNRTKRAKWPPSHMRRPGCTTRLGPTTVRCERPAHSPAFALCCYRCGAAMAHDEPRVPLIDYYLYALDLLFIIPENLGFISNSICMMARP